jgi:SAM-dependent methyltransferase
VARDAHQSRSAGLRSGARFLAFVALLTAAPVSAELDVPYVPTPQVVVDEMLRVARVGPQDFVMDLGSGDGRILIDAARKFGARGVGVELDDDLLAQSIENAQTAGVDDRVRFRKEDLFKADLSPATVVTMYLVPRVNERLRPRLLALKPGTRIVSHDFDLQDWRPDEKHTIRKNIFLWIVPAQVAGRWHARLALPGGAREVDFELKQHHQDIDGVAHADGRIISLWEMSLSGERVRFVMVDDRDREHEASLYFEARVQGDVMEGEVRRGVGKNQVRFPWRATRNPS